MGALLEIGASILSQATRRAEVSAQNISNMTTVGYKRRVSFESFIGAVELNTPQLPEQSIGTDFSEGKQIETGSPLDLAITGNGFFTVATADGVLYTRQGQLQRDRDGRLLTAPGLALQAEAGGDLVLRDGPFQVTSEGVVIQDGAPIAKLAIAELTDPTATTHEPGGLFAAPEGSVSPAKASVLRQGALESSNVSTADEMVGLMEAVRRAETGQRLIGIYDDLMGRALTAFGQA